MTDVYLSRIPKSPRYRNVLPPQRQALHDATRNGQVKAQRYTAWTTLLTGLKNSRWLEAEEAKLGKDANGKWASEMCGISISHCRTAAAAAISDGAVGVDLEPLRDPRYRESLLNRITAETERERFSALSAKQRIPVLWTRKEAAFKRGEEAVFSPAAVDAAAENIRTVVIRLDRDYVLSVAAAEGDTLRIFEVRRGTVLQRTDYRVLG